MNDYKKYLITMVFVEEPLALPCLIKRCLTNCDLTDNAAIRHWHQLGRACSVFAVIQANISQSL